MRPLFLSFVIVCFAGLCLTGCQSGKKPEPEKNVSIDEQYNQLIQKRYDLQCKIEQAMILYKEFAEKTKKQRDKLKKSLGETSLTTAIDIFQNKKDAIPSNLRIAYSYWRLLLPDEKQRLKIAGWLNKQQENDMLGEFEIKMKTVENFLKMGTFMNETDQKDVDRLLSTQITDWDKSESNGDLFYEQQAIEELKDN